MLRIATDINRWYMAAIGAGVSLRLNAVQIISLETWGGVTAEAAGFDAVEGGFDGSDLGADAFAGTPEGEPEQADEAAEESDDDGDF